MIVFKFGYAYLDDTNVYTILSPVYQFNIFTSLQIYMVPFPSCFIFSTSKLL